MTHSTAAVRCALAAAGVLLVAAPSPARTLRTLADAGSATVVTDPLVALVALLAWCCAAYLLLVAGLTGGSRLPTVGPVLAAGARRLAPAGLRRALEVALGISLVVGTLGGGVASAAGPAPASGRVVGAVDERSTALRPQSGHAEPAVPAPVVAPPPQTPSLDHPVDAGATPSLDHPAGVAATPSLDHPVGVSATPSLDHPVGVSATPSLDHPVDGTVAVDVPRAAPVGDARDTVVVQPGDSLWSIAGDHLEQDAGSIVSDAKVAQAWPAWWQANREAIGDDPDLLRPGTPLVPPDGPSSGASP